MTTRTEPEAWNDRVMTQIIAKIDAALECTGSRYSKHAMASARRMATTPPPPAREKADNIARIERALRDHPALSTRAIAERLGLAETTVGRHRRRLQLHRERREDDLTPRGETEARVQAAFAQNPNAGYREIAALANASEGYAADIIRRVKLAGGQAK